MQKPASICFLLLVFLNPVNLASQVNMVDEGIFLIEIGGQQIGTESFKIRSVGTGTEMRIIAQGELTISTEEADETIQSALGAVGPTMSIEAYQTRISSSNLEINLQRRGNRFFSFSSSDSHLEEREYRRISNQIPTIILDEHFAHHYFLLLPHQFIANKEVSVVAPRVGQQNTAILSLGSVEPLTIGNERVQAQYLELNVENSIHRIWTDGQKRILRVEIPQGSFVAYRILGPAD